MNPLLLNENNLLNELFHCLLRQDFWLEIIINTVLKRLIYHYNIFTFFNFMLMETYNLRDLLVDVFSYKRKYIQNISISKFNDFISYCR